MKTLPLVLDQVKHPLISTFLYHHQAIMLDEWEKHDAFLVETKTGTGKTTAAVLPLLKYKENAFLVYPTNELIRDQIQSIAAIARQEGLVPCIYTPNTSKEEYGKADVVLVHIDAEKLKEWDKKLHLGGNWAVLKYLLQDDKKLILTNPDILFLIFALRYKAEALVALMAYRNIIIDEFHLYQGVEFAHALFMVHLARNFGFFNRVVLLSATPAPEVRECVDQLLQPYVIDSDSISQYQIVSQRIAVHEIEIIPQNIGEDVVEKTVEIIKKLKETAEHLRKKNLSQEYIPIVVVLNSVINAMYLEDRLVKEGFKREELLIIRGLTSKAVRVKDEKKLIAIGTSAIEVGIDFKCDYLIFEASEAPSFLQRFGRLGRHQPGTAYILCKPNVELGIERLPAQISRNIFEKYVYDWYLTPQSRPWFVFTEGGLITVYSLANRILSRVIKNDVDKIDSIEQIIKRFNEILLDYASALGIEKHYAIVKRMFSLAQQGKIQWVKVYQDLNTFRTSLPSITVCDFAEKERRSGFEFAKYNVDLGTLIKRGEGISYSEKIMDSDGRYGMVTVRKYGRYKKVRVIPEFTDENCRDIMVTSEWPQMAFLQDGQRLPVSSIMTLRDHIFVVLPKIIETEIDWRFSVFECGNHLIAFDGTALLLREMFYRMKDNQG
jgi:CRISPR-associated helicase Cas3